MRRSIFLLGSLVATAALFACEDDSSTGNPGTFNPDSGTYQAPDATTPDASTADAQPDATAPTSVTVKILANDVPVAGKTIIFHDAAGAVIGTAQTDAAGKATSTGAVPAQVTALLGGGHSKQLLTWTAVEAGDELVANDIPETDVPSVSNYSITPPGQATGPSIDGYVRSCYGSAEGQAASFSIALHPQCLSASNAVLLISSNGEGRTGFAYKKGLAAPAAGQTDPVTVPAPWLAPTDVAVVAANLPPNSFDSYALHTDVIDGVGYGEGYPLGLSVEGSVVKAVPATLAQGRQFAGVVFTNGGTETSVILKRVAAAAVATTLDFATELPHINGATIDATDVTRPKIEWTSAAPLTSTDGGVVFIAFYERNSEAPNVGWSFVVAPGATNVQAPQLPPEAAEWAPAAADSGKVVEYDSEPEILFAESDLLSAYSAFRQEAGRLLPQSLPGDPSRVATSVLPAAGTVRTTAYKHVTPR